MERVKRMLATIRLWLILPWIDWKNERFRQDLARWKPIYCRDRSDKAALALILWDYPEFRNLVIYRHRRSFARFWMAAVYRPMDTLFIQTPDIGGGLFIQHGFSTMIAAKSIGENCWINQQVTIGYRDTKVPPVIGNNVMITCGAKVLGEVIVGDGAVIGANAVVIRDVEAGAVMGGVPAKRLK